MNAVERWAKALAAAIGFALASPVVLVVFGPMMFVAVIILGCLCSVPLFIRALAATFPAHFRKKFGGTLPLAVLLASGAANPSEVEAAVYPSGEDGAALCIASSPGPVGPRVAEVAQEEEFECSPYQLARQCSECSLMVLACGAAVAAAGTPFVGWAVAAPVVVPVSSSSSSSSSSSLAVVR